MLGRATSVSNVLLGALVLLVALVDSRHLFYDTNPGEGFSMRRLALLRNLLLVADDPCSRLLSARCSAS